MVGRSAGFHSYLRPGRESTAQNVKPFAALELPLPFWLVMAIDRMNVKDGLCNIDPSSRNLRHGLLLIL